MNPAALLLRTLILAEKGRGNVSPNPEVGCMIVKNGKIISEGWHEKFGEAHAEVRAVQNAEKNGFSVEGADVFVSLEPCCHTNKKTPPCTQMLLSKKVNSVHIFFADPNPEVAGKGARILEENGIQVSWAKDDLQKKHEEFYKIFSHTIRKKTGFWTLKLAQTEEYFIGEQGEQKKITGEKCRKKTLKMRDIHQAILVGVNTVLVDNPELSGEKTSPIRIVLDPKGKLFGKEKNFQFFRDKNYIHIHSLENREEKNRIYCPRTKNGEMDLKFLKEFLYEQKISSVFVEGGGKTAKTMIEQQVLDEGVFFEAKNSIKISHPVEGINFRSLKNLSITKKTEVSEKETLFHGKFF